MDEIKGGNDGVKEVKEVKEVKQGKTKQQLEKESLKTFWQILVIAFATNIGFTIGYYFAAHGLIK